MDAHRRARPSIATIWRCLLAAACLLATTTLVQQATSSSTAAEGGTIVALSHRGTPYRGCPSFTTAWEGYPLVLTARISNRNYSEGETVRVTWTIGGGFPGRSLAGPIGGDGLPLYRYSGVTFLQAGWSQQEVLDWSKPAGASAERDGSSVVFRPDYTLPAGSNPLFEPGDVFWIDYRAPNPVGRGIDGTFGSNDRDYWGGVVRGIDRSSYADPGVVEETISCTSASSSNEAPTAGFTWEADPDDPQEVRFTDTSTDPEGQTLTYEWDFGDGATSSAASPTHTYAAPGSYLVTLEVTDPGGETDVASQRVDLLGLVVNSTGDAPAQDPEVGCDTGGIVDGGAECTLRAAIETAEARGGGEISFAIEGGGIPTVAAAAPLPATTTAVTIDGTSQPGGWVALQAAGEAGLRASGGTLELRGVAIAGAEVGIALTGGSGHTIEGNRIGTNPAGTAGAEGMATAVLVDAPTVTVADNVVVASLAVAVTAADASVAGNAIGVSDAGAPIGTVELGVGVVGAGASVADNTIRASDLGVWVTRASATDALVEGNRIGVSASGATLEGVQEAVRIDGAPGARVVDNHLRVNGAAAIGVTGSVQSVETAEGVDLESPFSEPLPGPVTGGRAILDGNRIDGDSDPTFPIAVWAEAGAVTVQGNVVQTRADRAVAIEGGSGHRVVGNDLGSAPFPVGTGISVEDVDQVVIGGSGITANQIVAEVVGVDVLGGSSAVQVQGTEVRPGGEAGELVGLRVGSEATAVTIAGSDVEGAQVGIASSSPGAAVSLNEVRAATRTGIEVLGDGATVTDNAVTGAQTGIGVGGAGVVLERNLVGLRSVSGAVVGSEAAGIVVSTGTARVERNVVAGSGTSGIVVAAGALGDLRANRVWQSEGPALSVADGPDAPTLLGVLRSGAGAETRTTLIVGALSTAGGERLEVYANDDCNDPEAKYVLETVRTTRADQAHRVIVIEGTTRDHFTVTTTTAAGSTSELSNCASVGTYPDGDGDGSVDPLDAAVGFEDDPTRAVVVTDDERLLLVWAAGGGVLERTQLGADPDPGSRPADWALAYGALSFRVVGLEPGAATKVVLASLEDGQTAGTSYWKYGPEVPGQREEWYRFDLDEASGTGATLVDTEVVGSIRRAWVLDLRDGARGDSDGAATGTITDPGGPVLVEGESEPEIPEGPVDLDPDPVPPAGDGAPAPIPGAAPAAVDRGTLPRTGGTPGAWALTGLLVLSAGLVTWAVGRSTRRPSRSVS